MKSRATAGFVLLEVIVALAIAALALGSLASLVGSGLGNVASAEQYMEATQHALSRLDRVGVTTPLVPGVQSGTEEGGFSWSVRISPPRVHAMPPKAGAKPAPALYDVEVTLSWHSGFSVRSVVIDSQRLGPAKGGNA